MVLVSNNYWIDDTRPCLTYGTRGVIHINVVISGPSRDLHSGVDGGAVVEPLFDLLAILASLSDSRGQILVPGFYDDVVAVSADEEALFDKVNLNMTEYCSDLGVRAVASTRSRDLLAARWLSPSLSVVSVDSTNSAKSFSKIPHTATAKLSIRFVPRQTAARLVALVSSHLETEFSKRRSPNTLKVEAVHSADWWQGDPKSPIYSAASRAIKEVWGTAPVLVREGGTMPITSFLSTHLAAPALLLPMGQSSDSAHLANERIRLSNLLRGKDVIKHLLSNLYTQPDIAANPPALDLHPIPVRPVVPCGPAGSHVHHHHSLPSPTLSSIAEGCSEPCQSTAAAAVAAVAAAAPAPGSSCSSRSLAFDHTASSLFHPPSAADQPATGAGDRKSVV